MVKYHLTPQKTIIAEVTDTDFIINESQDALDLMAEVSTNNCNHIIISQKNINSDFFNLKSGLAGEILQKFSNYNVRLAIIGDFTKYKSKSLQDFIRESNKRKTILFLNDFDTALLKLEK